MPRRASLSGWVLLLALGAGGHFDLFEPFRRRSLGQARVAGEPGKSHVACHVVSPMAAFLSFGCLIFHD
jgi:hypothetical protein